MHLKQSLFILGIDFGPVMKQPMKERVERFVVFPFAIGCTSDSSVAVGSSSGQQFKRPKPDSRPYTETASKHKLCFSESLL